MCRFSRFKENLRIIRVLMWKHCVVRKRRFIQTLVETVMPISLVVAIFILKEPMQNKTGGSKLFEPTFPVSTFSLQTTTPPAGILYIPYSPAANKLMAEVSTYLEAQAHAAGSNETHIISLGFDNVTLAIETMLLITSELKRIVAVIEFENMQGADLPDELKYTIRMASLLSWKPQLKHQRLFEKFQNVPQLFLTLQWAIDSSFLNLKTNSTTIKQKVTFAPLSALKPTLNKTYISTVFYLLTYISFMAPMLTFVFLMNRLLEEKATGIQELVQMVGVTPKLLTLTHVLNVLPPILVYCIGGAILLKAGESPMVPMTDGSLLFLNQFLHCLTVIGLAFACSKIFAGAQHTVSISLVSYLGLWIPIRLLGSSCQTDLFLFFHGLLPHCPSYWFLNEVLVSEVRQETGIQLDTIDTRFSVYPDDSKNGSVLFSYIMQLVQIIYLFLLAWYFEKVKPGHYGIALPWNFLFLKEYWIKHKNLPVIMNSSEPYDPEYKRYFEEPPDLVPGIKIQNVSKSFRSGKNVVHALNNVTFDIYEGEITVLLGHNGAGKTTLISIITGMISQSSGNIYVEGMNTLTQQSQVRKRIGFCPQHNLFFPDLTVVEHLMFFSLIKNVTFEEAKIDAQALMEELDLLSHANRKTSQLSGGLLRRLQLGCALCGNARVLVLDEPTSGLDVEARRELWDMLLMLRGERTLLLTTHFMEEADVLGDRIAALHLGKLHCHATPMFLKKAVGSGYRITINTINTVDDVSVKKISTALGAIVPGTQLKEISKKTLTYVLPGETDMVSTCKTLEAIQEGTGIESFGVGITTLEEVFLELCCDVDRSEKPDTGKQTEQFKYVNGCCLLGRQVKALLKRQIDFTKSNLFTFILLHIIMPVTLCTSLTQIFNINDKEKIQDLILNLDMYSGTGFSHTVYDIQHNASEKALTYIKETYPLYNFDVLSDTPFVHSLSVTKSMGGVDGVWNSYMVGISLNDTDAVVFYSPNLKHSAPVGLNLLSNILSIGILKNADGKSIITKLTQNWPVITKPYHIPKSKINCSLFAVFNIVTLIATASYDLTLPCKERLTVARHTHIMAGCSPVLYWLVTFFYHMSYYVIFCCPAVLFSAAFLDEDKTTDDKASLVAIFVVLLINGMNTYIYIYFISFCFNGKNASLVFASCFILFGFLTPILLMAIDDLKTQEEETTFNKIMNRIGLLIPAFVFTSAMIAVLDISRFNSFCINNILKCPHLVYYTKGFDAKLCCSKGTEKEGPFRHFAIDDYGAGKQILATVCQIFIFSILVLLIQYGKFNRWWNSMACCKNKYPPNKWNCTDVMAEQMYVASHIGQVEKRVTGDTLLMHRTWKVYRSWLGKRTYAVRGVSVSVQSGECLGLLGLNGSGKTTTYKLISTEESLTSGTINVDDHPANKSKKYLSCLGYCPQFFGLDDFRTGAANIRMLLILRGLSEDDVKKETNSWLEVVGMTKYGNRTVSGYSGGMVRRLATAASLCGGSSLTLLDEPTAGVDTAARRLVWAALKRGLNHNRAIVISSHSMDEMERLCHRVTILSNGEMAVLGTPQELKENYSPGHSIVFKLNVNVVFQDTGNERVEALKKSLGETFDCTMKDKHLTSLHYRINKKMKYSEIFAKMKEIVEKHGDVIEDYSVSETSLEDVFLAFAEGSQKKKEQQTAIPVALPSISE